MKLRLAQFSWSGSGLRNREQVIPSTMHRTPEGRARAMSEGRLTVVSHRPCCLSLDEAGLESEVLVSICQQN